MNFKLTHSNNTVPVYREIIEYLRAKGAFSGYLLNDQDLKLMELVSILENRNINSDSAVSMALFGVEKSSRYKKLKSQLKQFLVSKLLSSAPYDKSNQLRRVMANLNADYAAFNILYRRGKKTGATYLGEGIIAKGLEFGFLSFIPSISAELHEYFSIYEPNKLKAEKYKLLYTEYEETLRLERKAQLMYSELMNMFILEFDPGPKSIELAIQFERQLKKHENRINSVRFHVFFYQIKLFKYYSQRDFIEMDKIALNALNYFTNLKHRRFQIENMFLRKRVEANLILQKRELCKILLSQILNNSSPGFSNWYNTLEIFITIRLHEEQYHEVIKLFLLGKNHKNYDNLIVITKKRWGLLEAYINFLQLIGVAPESPTMSRFRINRFINDTPQYEEDKKGRNIQLIIAQLLFYIVDKNWDKMEEKIDALQKYGTRYLRKNELFRSQVFIKMLLEIPRRMYHPKAILRHTARYRKRLEEMAPNIDLNGSTLEIIPYEDLWELIIQNIVPPKYTRKAKLAEEKA